MQRAEFLKLLIASGLTFGCTRVDEMAENPDAKIVTLNCPPEGYFPNSELPVVVYKQAYKNTDSSEIIAKMKARDWHEFWRAGLYDFQHYHSAAHEVLACYRGSAKVQFGGVKGEVVDLEEGDVVFIPAGVAHKKVESTFTFAVVGGYPKGQYVDMKYGKEEELEKALKTIASVELPLQDPVFAKAGNLGELWGFTFKGTEK